MEDVLTDVVSLPSTRLFLVPKLKENDPNSGVTIAVLTAIGDLAQVSETEMRL